MSKPILCAGRLYCDVVFSGVPRMPTPGTEVFAGGLQLLGGGGAFITAATLAALGHRASQMSVIPAPPFDQIVMHDLAAFDVTATLCELAPRGLDPQITVAIADAGDRAFLTRSDGPAVPPCRASDLAPFGHLHIGELSTLADNPTLLESARSAGLTTSLDCGWQDEFDPDIAALVAEVDVFLPNAREYAALKDAGFPDDCARLTVIKNGRDGARARKRGQNDWTALAATPVDVVDATGAGDAFNGGFLSGWLSGAPMTDCLARGHACGAATVQAVGGTGGLRHLQRQGNLHVG